MRLDREISVRGGLVDHHLVDRPTGRLCQLVDILKDVNSSTPSRRQSTGRQGYEFSQLVDQVD
jgi:hypothetical protein